jgi:hypothetical protein
MPDIIPLFAVPVFKDDFFVQLTDKQFCSMLNTRHDDTANIDITTDSRVLNLPELSHLKSAAQSAMDVYTRDILHIHERAQLNITTSWYTTVTNRSRISNHFHGHSLFTGVIVFDASPGSKLILSLEAPPIVPKMFEFDYGEFNIFNSKSWWLDLEPNTIYIFPSTINHSAELSEDNTSMNLIAFDTFVSGSIGEDLNGIHVTTT